MRVALLVPHLFFQQQLLDKVIFSPGELALSLASELGRLGHEVTLLSPGPVGDKAKWRRLGVLNICADLDQFEYELAQRGDSYLDLLKKHPLTFITLARQIQVEMVVEAYHRANRGEFDVVHVWCNEEEQALAMAKLCRKPILFNHHEPFNFLARYRSIFPKYQYLNWASFSLSQRQTWPSPHSRDVNWVGNVYHGLALDQYRATFQKGEYLLYAGRLIEPKGVHYAIAVAKLLHCQLKIIGKHYAGYNQDHYWQEFIQPEIERGRIEFLGFINDISEKQRLFGRARVLMMPSTWSEPFGLVMIEALACGTPVVGFNRGSIPEVITSGKTGWVVPYQPENDLSCKTQDKLKWKTLKNNPQFLANVENLAAAVLQISQIKSENCRKEFEQRFSLRQMARGYEQIYQQLSADGI